MQRLKTRVQFQAVLAGAVIAKTAHFALHCTSLDVSGAGNTASKANKVVHAGKSGLAASLFRQQDMWIGAMVPKRWAKRAATRNTIKRQIYAVGSEFCNAYPHSAFVVRLRYGFARSEFLSAVSDQLRQAVRSEVQALMETGAKVL